MSTTRHGSSHVIIASSINSNGRTSEFFADAKISPLTEPARPYQSAGLFQSAGISQSMSIRERVWKQRYTPFCPGTEKWDRTPGVEMPFCPRPRRFVPGENVWDRTAGTERPGTLFRDFVFFKMITIRMCNLRNSSIHHRTFSRSALLEINLRTLW